MIDFLKYRRLYFGLSSLVIIIGLISIVTGGLKYSIEFTGGTIIEYQVQNKVYKVRTIPLGQTQEANFKKNLEKKYKTKVTFLNSETVGPILGKELLKKTLIAAILGVCGILLYIAFAFGGFNFAVAAIGALIHDILVLIGIYSLLGRFLGAEVDSLFVTALLTGMAFSVHDTIIIFDRIREYKREEGITNIEYYANRALVETLVRSVNNSMTIIFMLLALTLLGGTTIKFFVAALLIGTITGAYSSPFIATPLLLLLEKKKMK